MLQSAKSKENTEEKKDINPIIMTGTIIALKITVTHLTREFLGANIITVEIKKKKTETNMDLIVITPSAKKSITIVLTKKNIKAAKNKNKLVFTKTPPWLI